MNTWTYRLEYDLYTGSQQQRITGDTVQFDEPMDRNEILTGLWERWVLIRDENISVGNCSIELLSS